MRIDSFMKKAINGKINPATFLSEHRSYLCGFKSVLPVLALLENRTLYPTQALQQILTLMATEKDPVEETVDKKTGEVKLVAPPGLDKPGRKRGEPKKYQLFISYKTECGIRIEDLDEADTYQEATRIAHLRLFRREDSVYVDVFGLGISTRIMRDDAIRALLGQPLGGNRSTKRVGSTSSSLSMGVKSKAWNPRFSRG